MGLPGDVSLVSAAVLVVAGCGSRLRGARELTRGTPAWAGLLWHIISKPEKPLHREVELEGKPYITITPHGVRISEKASGQVLRYDLARPRER